jgi:hypothetical protein
MESIYMTATNPNGLPQEKLHESIRALLPFKTGAIEVEQDFDGEIAFNIDSEEGAYDEYPDGAEFGPDEHGVVVQWDSP